MTKREALEAVARRLDLAALYESSSLVGELPIAMEAVNEVGLSMPAALQQLFDGDPSPVLEAVQRMEVAAATLAAAAHKFHDATRRARRGAAA